MYEYNSNSYYPNTSINTSYFYGLNRTRKGQRGEMEEMLNMTGNEFPCISPRGKREVVYTADGEILAITSPDINDETYGFTGITSQGFYYNGEKKNDDSETPIDPLMSWSIIRASNLYIMNGSRDFDSVMYIYNCDTDKITGVPQLRDLCLSAMNETNKNYLGLKYTFETEIKTTENLDVQSWNRYETEYADYAFNKSKNPFEEMFKVGDTVEITGFTDGKQDPKTVFMYYDNKAVPQSTSFIANNTVNSEMYKNLDDVSKYSITKAVVNSFDTQERKITGGGNHYEHRIYFDLYNKYGDVINFDHMGGTGTLNRRYALNISLSLSRHRYSQITTHNGRLWGASIYGNRIFVSSRDDLFDTSDDSINKGYAARIEIDTPGKFTGLCEYKDTVLAFKENDLTVIYGNFPYTAENMNGIGCIDSKSIAVTPYGVIFLSHNGFYLYSGTPTPQLLSERLKTKYVRATSAWDGKLYYASAVTEDGEVELVVYDTQRRMWHKHDDFPMIGSARYKDGFYLADATTVYRQTDKPESDHWSFTSCFTLDNTLDYKAVNEIWILADIESGAYFKVFTSVDGDEFIMHRAFKGNGLQLFNCPIRARNGTQYRYRIVGQGNVVFYNIEIKKNETYGARNNTEKANSPVATKPINRESEDPY